MMAMTNEQLALAFSEGQEEALRELFRNFRVFFLTESRMYRDKMAGYDRDDFVQEGNILIWQILEKKGFQADHFTAYLKKAYRCKLSNLYRDYCRKNLITVDGSLSGEGDGFTVLAEAEYIRKNREKHRLEVKAAYANRKGANASLSTEAKREKRRARARAYYEKHRDEINEHKREKRKTLREAKAV